MIAFCRKTSARLNLLLAVQLLAVCLPAHAQQAKPATSLVELQRQLTEHLAQPWFDSAMWGLKVVSLDSGKVVFEHNAQKLFSPASNSKLYTVALALDRLGPDYRIRTSLYAKTRPNKSGVLKGDLIVYGRGDPTINSRVRGDSIYAALEPLVFGLTNAGVKRIEGDLVGDDSYFVGPPFGSGWAWDDMESYYGAEISSLTVNDNTVKISIKPGDKAGVPCKLRLSPATSYLSLSNRTQTIERGARRIRFHRPINQNIVYVTGQIAIDEGGYDDELTLHNPAGLFVALFKETLARHGIKVAGKGRTVNWLDRQTEAGDCEKLVELGFMESLPLRDIAREVMKPSQNLYTDLLLAHVGEKFRGPVDRQRNSEDVGIGELGKFLGEAGIKPGEVLFEEGSGLSRNNLTTPGATIALLQYVSQKPYAEAYLEALPIGAVDGTLKNRMKGTPAAGNVRAKTGTLRWANALSGHVTTAAGERLIFSAMLNRYYNDSNRPARPEIDAIAVMLAGFNGQTENR